MGLRYWWEYCDEKALVDTVGYHKSVKNPKWSQAHQFSWLLQSVRGANSRTFTSGIVLSTLGKTEPWPCGCHHGSVSFPNFRPWNPGIIPLVLFVFPFCQATLVRHCLVTKLNLSMSLKWSITPKKEKARFVFPCFFVVVFLFCLFSCANMKISTWSNFKARSLKPARWSFCFGYKLAFLILFLFRENLFTDPNVWFKFCLTFWLALFWCHVAGLLLWAECVQGILVRRGKDERSYWRRRLASLGWRGRMAAGECNMYS